MPAPLAAVGQWTFPSQAYRLFQHTLVYPSIWAAGGLASLVVFVQASAELAAQWQAALLVFASALVFYNLDRIADSHLQASPDPDARRYFRGPWGWLVLVAAGLTTAALLADANRATLLVCLGGLVAFTYGLPLIPWRAAPGFTWRRLKDIPASKAWIVASVVTYALIGIPLAYAGTSLTLSTAVTALFLLVFIGTNTHLFDVRDLGSDREAEVVTLPLLVGVAANRRIWSALNLAMIPVLGWAWANGLAVPPPMVVLACVGANLVLLHWARADTPRAFYDIFVDGCLFLPCLLIVLMQVAGWR